jgi:hypothetical protein
LYKEFDWEFTKIGKINPLEKPGSEVYGGPMFTSQDLQQIKMVIAEAMDQRTTALENHLTQKIETLDQKNTAVGNRLTKGIRGIEKDITTIKKDAKTILNFFDRENLDLVHRVDRIEQHLGIHPLT